MRRTTLLVAALAMPFALLGCEGTPVGPDTSSPSFEAVVTEDEVAAPAPPAENPPEEEDCEALEEFVTDFGADPAVTCADFF